MKCNLSKYFPYQSPLFQILAVTFSLVCNLWGTHTKNRLWCLFISLHCLLLASLLKNTHLLCNENVFNGMEARLRHYCSFPQCWKVSAQWVTLVKEHYTGPRSTIIHHLYTVSCVHRPSQVSVHHHLTMANGEIVLVCVVIQTLFLKTSVSSNVFPVVKRVILYTFQ